MTNERIPELGALLKHLKTIFDKNQVTKLQFKIRLGTDRSSISTQILYSHDFVDSFYDALENLKPHAYSAAA